MSYYTVVVYLDETRDAAVSRAAWAGHATHQGVTFAAVLDEPTTLNALIKASVALERRTAEVLIAREHDGA